MFEAHFQTFEEPETGVALSARLSAFREELAKRNLSGFVVPRADQQQNEYVAAFRGAAGLAHRLYRLRRHGHRARPRGRGVRRRPLYAASRQAGRHQGLERRSHWSTRRRRPGWRSISPAGDRLGFDPWLHTTGSAEKLAAACAKAGAELVAVDTNPVDTVWTERPPLPLAPVALHGQQFAGEVEADKLKRIEAEIAKLGADALVLSDSHAVAWTFNIRGGDVAHTPLPLSYALVPKSGRPTLFVDHRKLSNSVRDHLERTATVVEPGALTPKLIELSKSGASIALDSATPPPMR